MKAAAAPVPDQPPVCFPPVSSPAATLLILGSFPGRASLARQQYYGHRRNSFWPIMARLLGFDPSLDYGQRIERLHRHGIALWDVLASCRRPGSLDSAIEPETMVINDFTTFFAVHPGIGTVLFNGAMAERQFTNRVISRGAFRTKSLRCLRLPSTSPAMAMLDFEQKLAAWGIINDLLADSLAPAPSNLATEEERDG